MKQNLESYMVKGPYVCDPEMKLKDAYELMRELDFRHLPVTEDEKLIGILSERDLREALAYPKTPSLQVQDIMQKSVFAVRKDTPLKSVAREMAEQKWGSAIVVDKDHGVIGIFTTTDALRILAELLDEEDENDFVLTEQFYESWSPNTEISY